MTKFSPCTDADQKAFLVVPGIQDAVKTTFKFNSADKIEIIAEAVSQLSNGTRKYLVMAGKDIESEDDNREGYVSIKDGKLQNVEAIILPVLS